MSGILETLLILLIVSGAAIYLAYRFWKDILKASGESMSACGGKKAACGCGRRVAKSLRSEA